MMGRSKAKADDDGDWEIDVEGGEQEEEEEEEVYVDPDDEDFQPAFSPESRGRKRSRGEDNVGDQDDEEAGEKEGASATKKSGGKKRGSGVFQKRMEALGAKTLANVLTQLVFDQEVLSVAQIEAVLPGFDLESAKTHLIKLNKRMHNSFPHARWGSNDDAYALKRVRPAMRVYDEACKDVINRLANAGAWTELREFASWFESTLHWPSSGAFAGSGSKVMALLEKKVAQAEKKKR